MLSYMQNRKSTPVWDAFACVSVEGLAEGDLLLTFYRHRGSNVKRFQYADKGQQSSRRLLMMLFTKQEIEVFAF